MHGHDIVTIGASAGGLEVLRELVSRLPANVPASFFVVVHVPPFSESSLPEILTRAGALRANHPRDHDRIKPGQIYVAPPDQHLLVAEGFVRVVQGPKENNARPAIDPLFRTAAVSYGPRVIGIVLSGSLDDGTAGLGAVKARGGIAMVQDPEEALYSDMPASALNNVAVDHCLPIAKLSAVLAQTISKPADEKGAKPVSDQLKYEAAMAAWDTEALLGQEHPGQPSTLTCPSCGGELWELVQDNHSHYRCRTGHAFSPMALLAGQSENLDTILNEAFRALKEKEDFEKRLSRRCRRGNQEKAAVYHEHQAENAEKYAAIIWDMLRRNKDISQTPLE